MIDARPEEAPHASAWQIAGTTGWLAAKQNRFPALVMWLFGVALVTGYFCFPRFHDLLDSIGKVKEGLGWKFSLVSTAIFGGLIPASIGQFSGERSMSKRGAEYILVSTLLWGYKGVEIDFFYRLQGWLFGTTADFSTVAVKTMCDQFLMVPVFGLVNVVLFYVWRDCGYSFRKLFAILQPGWYRRLVFPALIANWIIWIPAVAMIYCLPGSLQLPVQNLILCFWVLILTFFTGRQAAAPLPHRKAAVSKG